MSAIQFTIGEHTYTGTITTIDEEKEVQYFINLGQNLQFTIHISEDSCWESNNPAIDPLIVRTAGDYIENMEDLSDVLTKLDPLH